jgi:hypothetical protein
MQAKRMGIAAAITLLMAMAFQSQAQAATGKGTFKSYDAEMKKLVVSEGTKKKSTDVEYIVADDAKITVNKKDAKADELEDGDKLTITFEEKDSVKTVSKIVVTRAKKKE